MHLIESKGRSQQISTSRRTIVLESTRSQYYKRDAVEWEKEKPEATIYRVLLTLLRKQTRKPFQLFKQFFLFSEDESSIEVGYKHSKFELEMVEENIRSACTRIRQRMLVDGFITIKNLFLKKQAYYSEKNLQILHKSVSNFQQFYMKWEGFGRLYEYFRGNRLLKLNLSKIEAFSNDYTSRELEDFRPFLTDRTKEGDAVHSQIIDHISQNEENSQGKNRKKAQRAHINEIEEECFEENNRSLKKSSTAYHSLKKAEETEELQSKALATHRKERKREEAESTARPSRIKAQNEPEVQQIYLIRDYGFKKSAPSNYIKVPVLSQNLKIVEINTKRKRQQKKRVARQSIEMQTQICANCKYCLMLREEKEMVRMISKRLETSKVMQIESASEYIAGK